MKLSAKLKKIPLLRHILLQISLWSLLNISLAGFVYLNFGLLISVYNLPVNLTFSRLLLYGLGLAVFHGIILGILGYWTNQLFFKLKSVSPVLIIQSLLSLLVFLVTFYGVVHSSGDPLLLPESNFDSETWSFVFHILLLHYTVGSILITFTNHVVRKYGRNVFLPMLLGVYRKPRDEDKIFMFLDLKSSTALAEHLGHLTYSRLVQEFMIDINKCLDDYNAYIYQYAGDEVVLTWETSQENSLLALRFFFACVAQINRREDFYFKNFGTVPAFKAGIDCGKVTAVEIGDLKRDIAYHGDSINTAARIQALCNSFDKKLLISKSLAGRLPAEHSFQLEAMGSFLLRGKEEAVELYAISE